VSTPRPQVLEKKVAELGRKVSELYAAAKKLQDPYTVAYGMAYEPASGGGTGASTEISQSDPTGDVAVEQERRERARTVCTHVVASVDGVVEELEELVKEIEGAQTSLVGKRGVVRRAGPWDFAEAHQAEKSMGGGATF
jgi:hypothetical protein